MPSEIEMLRNLNVNIANKESEGNVDYFTALLAPKFAMHRANGEFNDRDDFLEAVKKSPERRTQNVSVTMYGDTTAIVSCIVLFPVGPQAKRFHNLRLFTRSDAGREWQLLAWSNESSPILWPESEGRPKEARRCGTSTFNSATTSSSNPLT